jgi:hypothetical protein
MVEKAAIIARRVYACMGDEAKAAQSPCDADAARRRQKGIAGRLLGGKEIVQRTAGNACLHATTTTNPSAQPSTVHVDDEPISMVDECR